MKVDTRKLVTIVAEALLEHTLLGDLQRLGAHGYTVTDARGKGNRGAREGNWEPNANIRIEVVCDEPTAERISAYLWERYYRNYGMILYLSDVQVLRPEKF